VLGLSSASAWLANRLWGGVRQNCGYSCTYVLVVWTENTPWSSRGVAGVAVTGTTNLRTLVLPASTVPYARHTYRLLPAYSIYSGGPVGPK